MSGFVQNRRVSGAFNPRQAQLLSGKSFFYWDSVDSLGYYAENQIFIGTVWKVSVIMWRFKLFLGQCG